ncbi:MAG: ECF transporter S component [bacterium]|nr:ECF transporter S component [bacterium]
MTVKELVTGALLAAMALVIPLFFRGWLQIVIPPFSATLASHVPVMLAMFISPVVAAMVGLASTLGFLVTLGAVVAARASIHIGWAFLGAILYRRGLHPLAVLLLAIPLHAGGEGLVVIPLGFALPAAWLVAWGTAVHHLLDMSITLLIYPLLLSYFPRPGRVRGG